VTLGYVWGYGKLEETARDDLSASLAATIDDVGSLVEIDGKVVDGYADDELARLSAEVDLLICGSRRRGRLGRVMLGSVSAGVLRKARCPVLVVPRGAPDDFASLPTVAGWQHPEPAVAATPTSDEGFEALRAACPVIVVPRGTERAIESLAGQVAEPEHA
jgi:hypothetical protein